MSRVIGIKFEDKIRNFARINVPYSNVIGLARSILALGTLLTLFFNPIENLLIKKTNGEFVLQALLNDDFITVINFFLIFGADNIIIGKWLAILILLAVISGYYQKILRLKHMSDH